MTLRILPALALAFGLAAAPLAAPPAAGCGPAPPHAEWPTFAPPFARNLLRR